MNTRSSVPLAALSSERPNALSELALARKADAVWVDWRCTLHPVEIGDCQTQHWVKMSGAKGMQPTVDLPGFPGFPGFCSGRRHGDVFATIRTERRKLLAMRLKYCTCPDSAILVPCS